MLRVESVTAGYGQTTVLRDLSLDVPTGTVVALLGPNGAGKTTLLRVVSGLLSPRAGRLLLDGKDVTGLSAYARAKAGICHVPEGGGVFGPLSIRENLLMFSPKGKEKESLERAVEAFPILGERLNQLAGTLSGGQQRMLALARAYVSGAKLILLDEMSMGLAPIVVDEIFEFIGRLAGSGVSLLLVEQYVPKALGVADYVYIVGRGRLSFAGDTAELAEEDVFGRYLGMDVAQSG